MGDKKIRVSDEIYEQLQKLAERTGRSMRELTEEAIKAYLLGTENIDKPVKSVSAKVIPLQYPSRCRFCGKEIKQGELAYWAKYTFTDNSTRSYVICLDCYYKDTALADWYLKKKKLEAVVRGLKKKADKLAEQVEALRLERDIYSVKRDIVSTWDHYKTYLYSSSKDDAKIQEIFERLQELADKIAELEAGMKLIAEHKLKIRESRVMLDG